MSEFEFFFSLFGLILGLAIAVVIGGLSDVLRERSRIEVGFLTPMLALFVLFDLSSLWVNTWAGMVDIQVAYGPFIAALIVAGIYFFSASMIFPKTATDWPSLDHYYMGHYRWVIGGVIAANIGVILIDTVTDQAWTKLPTRFTGSPVTSLWWVFLIVLWAVPRRRVQLSCLALLLLIALYALIAYWGPI